MPGPTSSRRPAGESQALLLPPLLVELLLELDEELDEELLLVLDELELEVELELLELDELPPPDELLASPLPPQATSSAVNRAIVVYFVNRVVCIADILYAEWACWPHRGPARCRAERMHDDRCIGPLKCSRWRTQVFSTLPAPISAA